MQLYLFFSLVDSYGGSYKIYKRGAYKTRAYCAFDLFKWGKYS